jgi:hypothetical protein
MSLLSECFSGMKVVKWFCYEEKFLERESCSKSLISVRLRIDVYMKVYRVYAGKNLTAYGTSK